MLKHHELLPAVGGQREKLRAAPSHPPISQAKMPIQVLLCMTENPTDTADNSDMSKTSSKYTSENSVSAADCLKY